MDFIQELKKILPNLTFEEQTKVWELAIKYASSFK